MKRWPTRKLTKADGEYILWHALEYLTDSSEEEIEAQRTIRTLLNRIQGRTPEGYRL